MLPAVIAMTSLISQAPAAAPTIQPCLSQPMPAALDSVGKPPIASDVIEFSATPSLQHPERAWVVRVSRRGTVEARIEVVRLRRQETCNRYDIEARWQAPLQQAEYGVIAKRVMPVAVPAASVFIPVPLGQLPEVVTDGTGLRLRLRSAEWEVSRSLNHYDRDGGTISAIFRDLVSKSVPASELPREDWRTN
ncbi:hypothetical protein ACBY01_10435 [Sphingomonas sp. ac-8]|uniref:hypothetical protein n=1 Tax=Sphingomonas sp. ac-8 TaxID=3242977 RepID=UPI003A803726